MPAYSTTAATGSNGKAKSQDPPEKYRLNRELRLGKLTRAMTRSRANLKPYRMERRETIKLFAGNRWGENGAATPQPLQLLGKFLQVMCRALVPKSPQVMLSTMDLASAPAVDGIESWLNEHIERTYFAEKCRRFVMDGLTGLGCMKVAVASPANEIESYETPSGVPFCELIDLDDLAYDPGCTSVERAGWVAHRYRVPLEEARGLGFFEGKARRLLESDEAYNFNADDGDERASTLSKGYQISGDEDYEEMVTLWEVWLRRPGKVVTFAATPSGGVPDGNELRVLKVVDWVGPACGPYHWLYFFSVPANAMPVAPTQNLSPMHELINELYTKLSEQALDQKSVLPVRGGQMDDYRNLKQASNGDMVACENAENIKEVSYGGPSPINLQFVVNALDLYNKQANNLDLLSGTGPQSKTASQDKMLNENAGAAVQDYQEAVVVAISKVLDAYCWYLWYHPELVMQTLKGPDSAPEVRLTRRVYPGHGGQPEDGKNRRRGPYEALRLRVNPHSLQFKSPQQRLAYIDQAVKDALPAMPLLAQQGITYDAQAHFKLKAKYADEPDLLRVFTLGEPVAPPAGPGGSSGRMPSETSREYVRRSVGQDTQANREGEMANSLAEASAQFSEGSEP